MEIPPSDGGKYPGPAIERAQSERAVGDLAGILSWKKAGSEAWISRRRN